MLRYPRHRLPRPHSAFADILSKEEAASYLPCLMDGPNLTYVGLYGYGWQRRITRKADGHEDSAAQESREPIAIVTWDERRREVVSVTGFRYPFCVEFQSLMMTIERPDDLTDLLDLMQPFVDPRDRRVQLA